MTKETKEIKELRFIEDNYNEITELLVLRDNANKAENEYVKAKNRLLRKMKSKKLSVIHIPDLKVRIQVFEGRFTRKINTKKLKNELPDIYEKYSNANYSDNYIAIYKMKRNRKKKK